MKLLDEEASKKYMSPPIVQMLEMQFVLYFVNNIHRGKYYLHVRLQFQLVVYKSKKVTITTLGKLLSKKPFKMYFPEI